MYSAFVEVLYDLWDFVTPKQFMRNNTHTVFAAPRQSVQPTAASVDSTSQKTHYSVESRLGYIQVPEVACLQVIGKKFDTVRGTLKYGDGVKIVREKDDWYFVESGAMQGWVETQAVTTEASSVFPQFTSGQLFDVNDSETKKLRLYLRDELRGGVLGRNLQPTEYIMYRLKRLGAVVAWPLERPRLPGKWQTILNGKRGVSLGFEPKTSSVVECASVNQEFLAFVESVAPDETIVVSSVGRGEDGHFETKEFTSAQWKLWQPVFISFT